MPLYALSIFDIPQMFSLNIEEIQKHFLWMGMEKKKRMALISWDKVFMPINKGGRPKKGYNYE